MTLQRKQQMRRSGANIRQLKPGEDPPSGEPRRYASDPRGYVRLRWRVGKGEYVETYEHRLVAGVPAADVHHDDEDKSNNARGNLTPMSRSEHARMHGEEQAAKSKRLTEWGGYPSQYAFDKAQRSKARRESRERFAAEICRLQESGMSTVEIGKTVGLDASGISRILRSSGVAPPRRPGRSTGPSTTVRSQIQARARMRCERCGRNLTWEGGQIHHRKPRQMGGTRDQKTNSMENLVFICSGCHSEIESNRDDSYRDGWLVHSWDDPARVALLAYDGVPVVHG